MSRRLRQAAVAFVVLLVAVQFIRPDRTNPATKESRAIGAHLGAKSEFIAVLNRACNDCHSNMTVWPWYTEIAPLSWLMAYAVKEGRKAVNFSKWAAYPPDRQRMLLAESCVDAKTGKMPGAYALLHPEMWLSATDVETICAAVPQTGAPASRVSQ